MVAGLAQYSVGEYSDGVDAEDKPGQPRIKLALPPHNNDDLQRHLHNRLVLFVRVVSGPFRGSCCGQGFHAEGGPPSCGTACALRASATSPHASSTSRQSGNRSQREQALARRMVSGCCHDRVNEVSNVVLRHVVVQNQQQLSPPSSKSLSSAFFSPQ